MNTVPWQNLAAPRSRSPHWLAQRIWRAGIGGPRTGLEPHQPPWTRHRTNRRFDEDRCVVTHGTAEQTLKRFGRLGAPERDVEGGGQAIESGIAQISLVSRAELRLLETQYIAELAIGEHNHSHIEIVLAQRRQLLHGPTEATVAVHADHRAARIAGGDTERGREAVAERALVAGREEGSGPKDRVHRACQVADLGEFAHQHAVL